MSWYLQENKVAEISVIVRNEKKNSIKMTAGWLKNSGFYIHHIAGLKEIVNTTQNTHLEDLNATQSKPQS